MPAQSNPLSVIVNPPGLQVGMPGDLLELHVLITNQGRYGALIDVFIDEASSTLGQWCTSPSQRIALDPGHSGEVSFQFEVPFEALPGTYNYTLVVDAPEHYPEDTPIKYDDCLLKVLMKEQTVVGISDPTFSLQPPTNPEHPIVVKPNEPLSVMVTVDNRSNRVDNFRLTCPDLATDWYTIRYPTTGLEGSGLLAASSGINLNPGTQGTIVFQLHPPADTLAGNYSPTIRLHSVNFSDLVLLDLIYIHIPTTYQLDIELNTILGKVSRSSGQYEIKLINRGNTIRELAINARGRDEEDLCAYRCDPPQERLIPGKIARVNLLVTPTQWWRRSLWGRGLDLNFQVEIQDLQNYSLPDKLPQGTLIWKARPWWQFLLLGMAILGLLGGVAFIVWQIFFKPAPLQIVSFEPSTRRYTEGNDSVHFSWRIGNPQQLQTLVLKVQGSDAREIKYQFEQDELKELKNKQPTGCKLKQEQFQILDCNNIDTGVQKPGKYTFVLEGSDRQGKTVSSENEEVFVNAKPAPEVFKPKVDKTKYIVGEKINLQWQIKNSDQLSQLTIDTKVNGTRVTDPSVFTLEQLESVCSEPHKQIRNCQFPINTVKSGKYAFEFQVDSTSGEQLSTAKTTEEIEDVEVLPQPGRIVYFRLNGQQAPATVSIPVGSRFNLQWKVDGEEITIKLNDSTVSSSGSQSQGPYPQAGSRKILLKVVDTSGQEVVSAGFDVEIVAPTSSSEIVNPNSGSNQNSSGNPSFDIESILPNESPSSPTSPSRPHPQQPKKSPSPSPSPFPLW